jgi:hypothetical protein
MMYIFKAFGKVWLEEVIRTTSALPLRLAAYLSNLHASFLNNYEAPIQVVVSYLAFHMDWPCFLLSSVIRWSVVRTVDNSVKYTKNRYYTIVIVESI